MDLIISKGSELYGKYFGESEKNIDAIFSLANNGENPAILFLDELDAL